MLYRSFYSVLACVWPTSAGVFRESRQLSVFLPAEVTVPLLKATSAVRVASDQSLSLTFLRAYLPTPVQAFSVGIPESRLLCPQQEIISP